ncbi:hypothetical protein CL634_08845 [bacterium]|nr:hypothetical protein [bacterium]|tara:strand:+ start:711 stop:1520 length:810 start_codon:yes stop_codon:yes gene_type:complete
MKFEQNEPTGLTTSCKDCVFSEKKDKTQIGCSLNRIEKFKEGGVYVVEAEDLEENEFYVIESWCNAYREEGWTEGADDIFAKVKKEYELKIGYIIIVDEETASDYENGLQRTLDSINAQSIPAHYIRIINKSPDDHIKVITASTRIIGEQEFDYKITSMLEKDAADGEAIDEVFNKVKNGFYIVARSGHELRPSLTANLNYAINENLFRVGYVEGYDGINGRTTQAAIHKHLNGYIIKPLKEKLIEVSGAEGRSDLIYTWDEIETSCTE